MAGGGAGCGVGHVAHAVGCPFFLFRPCFSFSFRCVCGGVGFGVFGYVGEGNVCPCQCVLCFSGWAAVWGLKINLYRLFLGWVSWCFGVCGGVLGAWVGWCGVCLAVFRGFWWRCGVRLVRGGFGGVWACGGTYYLPLSVRYALRCRFPFLGVENQPLGVVLGLWCGCERVLVDWWQGVGVTSCLLWVV